MNDMTESLFSTMELALLTSLSPDEAAPNATTIDQWRHQEGFLASTTTTWSLINDAASTTNNQSFRSNTSRTMLGRVWTGPDLTTLVIYMAFTMVVVLVGNIFLVFVIIRSNQKCARKINPVQLLILHTAVADILFALLTIMPTMLNTATFPYFHGSNGLCKIVRYLQVIPMYASPFLLVAISADRYQVCSIFVILQLSRDCHIPYSYRQYADHLQICNRIAIGARVSMLP